MDSPDTCSRAVPVSGSVQPELHIHPLLKTGKQQDSVFLAQVSDQALQMGNDITSSASTHKENINSPSSIKRKPVR